MRNLHFLSSIALVIIWASSPVTSITLDATQELIVTDDATSQGIKLGARTWSSREGHHYKKSKIAEKVFNGFDKVLQPILEQVLTSHPRSHELLKLRELKKVEITHHMVPMRDE